MQKSSIVKMSYIHKPCLHPLEHRTLIQLFDIHANNHPDVEAFIFYASAGQRSSHTFRQIQQMSLSLAASFLRLGWKRGQRIALMVPKQVEFVVSYMALLRIGVNVMLVPPYGRPIDEVFAQLKHLKSNGYIIHSSSVNPCSMIRDVLTDQEQVVWIDAKQEGTLQKGCHDYDELLTGEENGGVNAVLKVQEEVEFDDPAVVIFTSGSTGQPKAVQYTHHALTNTAIPSHVKDPAASRCEGRKIMLNDRPFYWIGGLLSVSSVMANGSTFITLPTTKTVKEKNISFVLNILQNEKCTLTFLTYYMISDLLKFQRLGEYDISSLKVIASGGQQVPMATLKELKAKLPHCTILIVYGSSEALSLCKNMLFPGREIDENDVAMEISPSFEVKIIDESKRLVPVGTVGEIAARSFKNFLEYLEDDAETAKVISRTGWVHMGDLGFIDQRGKLTICGRKCDVIKRATVKIYPAEVEKILMKHLDVNDVAVVGVPDVRLHEELCACIIPKQGRSFDPGMFEEWANQEFVVDEQGLSMKPKYTLLMEGFPQTKTGKLDRKALRVIVVQKLGIFKQ